MKSRTLTITLYRNDADNAYDVAIVGKLSNVDINRENIDFKAVLFCALSATMDAMHSLEAD